MMDDTGGARQMKTGFRQSIGNEASLNYCIEQCKAAMQYPPNGLPLLISGAAGTGKSFFVQLTYEYARRNAAFRCRGNW